MTGPPTYRDVSTDSNFSLVRNFVDRGSPPNPPRPRLLLLLLILLWFLDLRLSAPLFAEMVDTVVKEEQCVVR